MSIVVYGYSDIAYSDPLKFSNWVTVVLILKLYSIMNVLLEYSIRIHLTALLEYLDLRKLQYIPLLSKSTFEESI